jgi:hypothetical protein
MEPITSNELDEFLVESGVEVADQKLGIGRELSYMKPPLRTVVLYIAETDSIEYVSDAVSLILNNEEEWLLLARRGSATNLKLLETKTDFPAIRFKKEEFATLVKYLCTRSTSPGSFSADLYIISESGRTLITWDHHSSDEGISIQFQDVSSASKVLCSLNEFGAELELFYVDR